MTLAERLDEAIEAAGAGRVEAEEGGARAEAEVVRSERIGVRLRSVTVRPALPVDVPEVARALPDRLRALGERVVPHEVEPRLDRAILRTEPDDMRRREFFEVDVTKGGAEVTRQRGSDEGRERVDWDMTREQLGRLVDELEGPK